MNKNSEVETKFRDEAKNKGFEIFHKGYPDYVIRKDGKIIFVEVKRKCRSIKQGFSKHQLQMKAILQSLGCEYRVYRGSWEDCFNGKSSN
ncbi:MAG: hypothetical protein WC346_12465 [Methanogenium sp.]|jgi:hypothetical protein